MAICELNESVYENNNNLICSYATLATCTQLNSRCATQLGRCCVEWPLPPTRPPLESPQRPAAIAAVELKWRPLENAFGRSSALLLRAKTAAAAAATAARQTTTCSRLIGDECACLFVFGRPPNEVCSILVLPLCSSARGLPAHCALVESSRLNQTIT